MPLRYPKWKFYPMRLLLLTLAIACLSACGFLGFPGVYRINVEQGNIVTPEMTAQLQPGMNRRQVKFILGTPLVEDTFDQNRWDYIYVKRNGDKVLSESRLTVEFDGDTLVRLSGDMVPADWGQARTTAPGDAPATEPPPGIPTGG
ncbi:MAG: outer membrane protein assembly factor BamE [Halioglobus sp.]